MAKRELPPSFPMQLAIDIVDIAYMRLEPGCHELSGEFLLILSRITYENYAPFPGKEAKRAGPKLD